MDSDQAIDALSRQMYHAVTESVIKEKAWSQQINSLKVELKLRDSSAKFKNSIESDGKNLQKEVDHFKNLCSIFEKKSQKSADEVKQLQVDLETARN